MKNFSMIPVLVEGLQDDFPHLSVKARQFVFSSLTASCLVTTFVLHCSHCGGTVTKNANDFQYPVLEKVAAFVDPHLHLELKAT